MVSTVEKKRMSMLLRMLSAGFDAVAVQEDRDDEHQQEEIFHEALVCREGDAIAEAAAFAHFAGEKRITGKESKEDDEQQEQPAEQSHFVAHQYGHACNDLECDHEDGERKGVIV